MKHRETISLSWFGSVPMSLCVVHGLEYAKQIWLGSGFTSRLNELRRTELIIK